MRRDVNEFGGVERLGHFDRDGVGIDAISFAIAVESQRRHHGNDALGQKALEHLDIDALDLAGEQMVLAVNDAHGMRDEGVAAGGAKIIGAEALQNFVSQPVRRGQRQLERRPRR